MQNVHKTAHYLDWMKSVLAMLSIFTNNQVSFVMQTLHSTITSSGVAKIHCNSCRLFECAIITNVGYGLNEGLYRKAWRQARALSHFFQFHLSELYTAAWHSSLRSVFHITVYLSHCELYPDETSSWLFSLLSVPCVILVALARCFRPLSFVKASDKLSDDGV